MTKEEMKQKVLEILKGCNSKAEIEHAFDLVINMMSLAIEDWEFVTDVTYFHIALEQLKFVKEEYVEDFLSEEDFS